MYFAKVYFIHTYPCKYQKPNVLIMSVLFISIRICQSQINQQSKETFQYCSRECFINKLYPGKEATHTYSAQANRSSGDCRR